MNKILIIVLALFNVFLINSQPHLPIKISDNRRYFADQEGKLVKKFTNDKKSVQRVASPPGEDLLLVIAQK